MNTKWYILYTQPGLEKKVSDILTRKKIENYSPLNNVSRVWSDDRKVKEVPLFKGYVFVKISDHYHQELKKINGVVNLVYWMGKPVSIKNVEIKLMRLFLKEYTNVTLEKIPIKPDDDIDTVDNSVMEKEVPMITIKNKKACIALPALGYILAAEAESPNVRIINTEGILNEASIKSSNFIDKVSEFNNSLKNYWVKAFIISI